MGKVLHASKSGYFPFCQRNDINLPSRLQIDGTLEQIMALYWRVKRFRYTLTGGYFSDSGLFPITISGGSGVFEQNINPPNEEALVCAGPVLFTGSAKLSVGAFTITPNFYMALFQANFLSPLPFFQSTGGIYKTYFQIISDIVFGGGEFVNSIQTSEFSRACGNFSVKIFSTIIKSGTLFQTFDSNYSGNVSLIIEADEYWSYGGTYNTTTGEPL
jgi:hypothetical protein